MSDVHVYRNADSMGLHKPTIAAVVPCHVTTLGSTLGVASFGFTNVRTMERDAVIAASAIDHPTSGAPFSRGNCFSGRRMNWGVPD
jgi:hypothetical protein